MVRSSTFLFLFFLSKATGRAEVVSAFVAPATLIQARGLEVLARGEFILFLSLFYRSSPEYSGIK